MRETGNVSAAVTAVSPRGEDSRGVVALTMVYGLVLATEESARLVPIVKPGRASFFLQTLHGGWWRGWSKSYSKSQNGPRLVQLEIGTLPRCSVRWLIRDGVVVQALVPDSTNRQGMSHGPFCDGVVWSASHRDEGTFQACPAGLDNLSPESSSHRFQ